MGIGKILIDLIEQRQSNVNEIAKLANVAPSTLYSMIKRDSMKVDIEVLIKVCQALNIDVEYFYNKYKNGELGSESVEFFTKTEQNHIKKYRALDERGQQTVDTVLDNLYEIAVSQKETTATKKTNLNELSREEMHRILDNELDAVEKGQTSPASTGTNLKEIV